MSAKSENRELKLAFRRRGIEIDSRDVNILRLAQKTLHRWAERECNGEIERDEKTGHVYDHAVCYIDPRDSRHVYRVPDRETGALRRVREICTRLGLSYYYQTDPRGCALYVSQEPLTDQNYHNGIAC